MSEISREEAIETLKEVDCIGIIEKAKAKAISDMQKLEKIEEIAKTNYCEKCSLYNETCYGEDIGKCRYSDIEQILQGAEECMNF